MTTRKNSFNETVTTWESHIHPDNSDFGQVVFWTVWEKADGRVSISYNLGSGSKSKFIFGMSKDEAIARFFENI